MWRAVGMALAVAIGVGLPLGSAQAEVEAGDGWTRQTVPGVNVGVGYFTLKNTSKGRRELLKITSPLADSVELHVSSTDADGVAHMWPVGKLQLEPGEIARFSPNGRHLMLRGLKAPLRVGTRVPVTLVFEDELPITVQLEVRTLVETVHTAPGAEQHAAHPHP